MKIYPEFYDRLSPCAEIVNNHEFENGIVKIMRDEPLSLGEKEECAPFLASKKRPAPATGERQNFVADAIKKPRVEKVTKSKYDNVDWIPPTSNECERFFSRAKLVFSDLRKRLDSDTLELLMFLGFNRDFWDEYTVKAIRDARRSKPKVQQTLQQILV